MSFDLGNCLFQTLGSPMSISLAMEPLIWFPGDLGPRDFYASVG